MNFTKGPWKSVRCAPFSYRITTDRKDQVQDVIVHEVRCEENAQLVAAAPELYDALQALLDVAPFAVNAGDKEIHLRAQKALAKARGER